MEIVNDYVPAEIEAIFAQSGVSGMSSLPLTAMHEWMLNRDTLAQSGRPSGHTETEHDLVAQLFQPSLVLAHLNWED